MAEPLVLSESYLQTRTQAGVSTTHVQVLGGVLDELPGCPCCGEEPCEKEQAKQRRRSR